MTFAALLPYLLAGAGGFLIRHYNLLGGLFGFYPSAAANVKASVNPPPPLPTGSLPSATSGPMVWLASDNRPIVSDAVRAAIDRAVQDAVTGHVTSIKGELTAMIEASVQSVINAKKVTG